MKPTVDSWIGLSLSLALAAAPAVAQDTAANAGQATSAPADAASAEPEPSRFHLSLATDFTNAYYFRGIRQEDSALIVQPYADAAFDVFRGENATVSLKLGIWNSFHAEATASATDDSFTKYWYEFDVYFGAGLVVGKWAFDARYYVYASPSDAFNTVEEFDFSVAFDDSELLGAWAMKPSATIAVETSNAADGQHRGTYLQLGISPGFTFQDEPLKDIALTFPVTVGLSLSNYYEGTGGENDAFGYATVGAKVTIPLKLDASWGAWAISAGVQALFLGDATSSFNDDDNVEVIGTVGVAVAF